MYRVTRIFWRPLTESEILKKKLRKLVRQRNRLARRLGVPRGRRGR